MFTLESRLFLGYGALAAAVGTFYLMVTGDEMGGMLLLVVLGAAGAVAGLFLDTRGSVAKARDEAADGDDEAEAADDVEVRTAALPAPSGWPMVAAVSVSLLLVGVAVDVPLVVLGVGAVVLSVGGWFLQVWQEHGTISRPANVAVHDRILWPAGLPLLVFVGIAILVISFSRILLALPKEAATAVALVVAAGILAVCSVIAIRPRLPARLLTGLGSLGFVAVVVGGVVAAGAGEREFHYQGPTKLELAAKGVKFDHEKIEAPAHNQVVVIFKNEDEGIQHNVAVYEDESVEEVIYQGNIFSGVRTVEYKIRTGEPGEYFFRCDIHPVEMVGTLVVEEPKEGEEGEGHNG